MYWGPKVWPYVAGCALTNTSTFSCILGGVVFEKKKKPGHSASCAKLL